MKFAIIKSCLARFSGIFAVGTPSNIHGTAISYRCAKFGAFVNSVTILTLRDLTIWPLLKTLTFTHGKGCLHGARKILATGRSEKVEQRFVELTCRNFGPCGY